MKTILFLERNALTPLYLKMSQYIKNVRVIHVAFSAKEAELLALNGIKADYVYLDLFKEEYNKSVIDEDILDKIDNDIITQSNGRFNLNSAIQSDRGFSILNYEEALLSAIAHYKVWLKIFEQQHVDLISHEPCSLFFNYIACILCKKQGGVYTYQIACCSDRYEYAYKFVNNDDYNYYELKDLYKFYKDNPHKIDVTRCNNFLKQFRENPKVFLGDVIKRKTSMVKLLCESFRSSIYRLFKVDKNQKIYNNISYYIAINNRSWIKVKNLLKYKKYKIVFENDIPIGEKFLFYPLHLEPEASVLYLGDGLYKNQIKLIENIAASLPAGYYLYVKDHPHEYAYRQAEDYQKLLQIPNIRLLSQWIPAKAIISKSQGVVTLNGTAGFEAMLMNKPVYCFANNMYSFVRGVNYVKHIRDLREIISCTITKPIIEDSEILPYVMAYLENCYEGYADCYTGGPVIQGIDYERNSQMLAEDMIKYLDFMSSSLKNVGS